MESKIQKLKNIMACPHCHLQLKFYERYLECPRCNRNFPVKDGKAIFLDDDFQETVDSKFQVELMSNNTLIVRLCNACNRIVSSEYTPINQTAEFLKGAQRGSVIVELGSGNRRLRDDVINVDMFSFENADIIANIQKIPFSDNSVDYAILDTVLEHIPQPQKVINELYRILKPGAKAVCIAPFVFPYHGYPAHYFNFSKDGLGFLFRDFSSCKVEMNMGPTGAIINLITEYFAVALTNDNKILYALCKGLLLIPIFMFKYIDKLWNPSGKVVRIASHLCVFVTK